MPHFTILPSPPAPLGIDQWPPPPDWQLCWTDSLPDVDLAAIYLSNFPQLQNKNVCGTLKDQTLTVYGKYTQLLQGTVTRQTSPLTRKISVTRGTTTTVDESTTISVSFGISIPDLFDLGGKIDETVGFSQSWVTSKTTEDDFTIKTDGGEVSAIWWQAVYRYVFAATFVPGLMSQLSDIIERLLGTYPKEILLHCDTFSSSQYPPDARVSGSILKGR